MYFIGIPGLFIFVIEIRNTPRENKPIWEKGSLFMLTVLFVTTNNPSSLIGSKSRSLIIKPQGFWSMSVLRFGISFVVKLVIWEYP